MLPKTERDRRRYGNECYEDTESLLYQTCDELEDRLTTLVGAAKEFVAALRVLFMHHDVMDFVRDTDEMKRLALAETEICRALREIEDLYSGSDAKVET